MNQTFFFSLTSTPNSLSSVYSGVVGVLLSLQQGLFRLQCIFWEGSGCGLGEVGHWRKYLLRREKVGIAERFFWVSRVFSRVLEDIDMCCHDCIICFYGYLMYYYHCSCSMEIYSANYSAIYSANYTNHCQILAASQMPPLP